MYDKETIETYDKIAQWYNKAHADDSEIKEYLKRFLSMVPKGALVLDAGCGHGRDTRSLLGMGYKVISIDASRGMLERAKQNVPNGDFRRMDFGNMSFSDGTFDAVWCNAALLHIKRNEVDKAVKELARVLKQKGILMVNTKEGTGEEMRAYPDGTRRYFAFYSMTELEEIFKRAGFEVEWTLRLVANDGEKFITAIGRKL